ncbi:hypothetical protein BOTBODRAFT_169501 [Botryobasidium botryosum FD-172 SS1]|uniref:Uncharacterized protein n=1 Tax=Botryobasidium botryosum (strain FD-172 SS1) TaxID=930990 RepID=A0A067N9K1_BOTB1|nr:hypothetical protein BOTBODRAFT_169501 [Botryobasidium botryosum FD-172 SS1]
MTGSTLGALSPLYHITGVDSSSGSPTKKRRLQSTSSAATSSSRASSSVDRDSSDASLLAARYASSQRVLSVWSSLAKKYGGRSMEEDDIIDIYTGTIIKDRGVIRGIKEGTYAIGRFQAAAAVAEEEERRASEHLMDEEAERARAAEGKGDINADENTGASTTEEDEEDEDEDEDEDEIGGWGETSMLDTQFQETVAPLSQMQQRARELTREDEDDLREFLLAEEQRRAQETVSDEVEEGTVELTGFGGDDEDDDDPLALGPGDFYAPSRAVSEELGAPPDILLATVADVEPSPEGDHKENPRITERLKKPLKHQLSTTPLSGSPSAQNLAQSSSKSKKLKKQTSKGATPAQPAAAPRESDATTPRRKPTSKKGVKNILKAGARTPANREPDPDGPDITPPRNRVGSSRSTVVVASSERGTSPRARRRPSPVLASYDEASRPSRSSLPTRASTMDSEIIPDSQCEPDYLPDIEDSQCYEQDNLDGGTEAAPYDDAEENEGDGEPPEAVDAEDNGYESADPLELTARSMSPSPPLRPSPEEGDAEEPDPLDLLPEESVKVESSPTLAAASYPPTPHRTYEHSSTTPGHPDPYQHHRAPSYPHPPHLLSVPPHAHPHSHYGHSYPPPPLPPFPSDPNTLLAQVMYAYSVNYLAASHAGSSGHHMPPPSMPPPLYTSSTPQPAPPHGHGLYSDFWTPPRRQSSFAPSHHHAQSPSPWSHPYPPPDYRHYPPPPPPAHHYPGHADSSYHGYAAASSSRTPSSQTDDTDEIPDRETPSRAGGRAKTIAPRSRYPSGLSSSRSDTVVPTPPVPRIPRGRGEKRTASGTPRRPPPP